MAADLFDRKLLFVVGKGGVGKTTVAAAMAQAAVASKRRVLVIEMDREDHISPLLGRPPRSSWEPLEVSPGLYRMNVEGRRALEEYLALIIPIRRVLRSVFDSKVYQYFVAAAPGLKELMTIGKIWFEVDAGNFDLVIVDCPATGHSLQYLRMPKTALDTFPGGLVHREAKKVWGLLSDPLRTAVCVVTLAEEMPANETVELCRELGEELQLPAGRLFVNRLRESRFDRASLASLSELAAVSDPAEASLLAAVRGRAIEEQGWAERNAGYRKRVVAETGWSPVDLPLLFREEFGRAEVEELAGGIAAALDGGRAA